LYGRSSEFEAYLDLTHHDGGLCHEPNVDNNILCEGKEKVLTDENPLKWDPLFEPDVETIIEVAWISLQDLPPNFIARETIFSIKSVVGKLLTIDSKTKNQTRSSCARVKI